MSRRVSRRAPHRAVGGLALAFILGSRSRHLLRVSVRNVDQDTRALLTAVGTEKKGGGGCW